MASSSVVKLTAKTALKNKWLLAIAAALVLIFSYFTVLSAIGYIAYISNDAVAYIIFGLILFFVLSPLALGLLRFYWRFIFGAEDKLSLLFYYFSDKTKYFRTLKLLGTLLLRAVLAAAVLYLPSFAVDVFSGVWIYELLDMSIPIWASNLYYLSVFLKTVATVLLIFVMSKYYSAPFLIIADEEMDVLEAVHLSTIISRVSLLDFLCLILSFFGWLILSVLVLPLIYTLPYFAISLCVHTRFAIADYNKRIEQANSPQMPFYAEGI